MEKVMFFSENLYLESNDMPVEEITESEVSDAMEQAKDVDIASEGLAFDLYTADQLAILTEGYYNLREKMMNVEHIASIKASEGLVSESEQILSEAANGFFEKLKGFFTGLLNLIKNLFNKFVEFIMGLSVSAKQIANTNVSQAWAQYEKRVGKNNAQQDITIMNVKYGSMIKAGTVAKKILNYNSEYINNAASVFKRMKKGEVAEGFDKPKKLIDQVNKATDDVEEFILKAVSVNSEGKASTAFSTVKAKLTPDVFKERVQYVVKYKGLLSEVKSYKDQASKVVTEALKSVDEVKKANEAQKKYQSQFIAEIKWHGSVAAKTFSKLTSIMSKYYRESLSIARRVIGGNNAQDAKKDFKKMTEGFDYEGYFASAF